MKSLSKFAIALPCLLLRSILRHISWPAGAVAKCCDEHVCLSVGQDISGAIKRDLYQFLVVVAYGRGSVLFPQSDEIPRGRGNFGDFPPY